MLDVQRSPELQAAILGMRQAERQVRLDINKEARKVIGPQWVEALRGRSTTRTDIRILVQGARVAAGARQVTLKAATSKRPLSGGLVPSVNWPAQEFGMRNRKATMTTTSRKGNSYQVTKLIGSQFPNRRKNGRIAYDASSQIGTTLVGLWVRTIVDGFRLFADVKAGR